jgi:hypothetical protein
VIGKRSKVSLTAMTRYAEDVKLAGRFDGLFARARSAEEEFRDAQAAHAHVAELYQLGKRLDAALTDVMRSAFAAQRAAIGPRGYEDRIFRRQAMATDRVRAWTMEAQRLLTLREAHRLTGIPQLPRNPASPFTRAA